MGPSVFHMVLDGAGKENAPKRGRRPRDAISGGVKSLTNIMGAAGMQVNLHKHMILEGFCGAS